MMLSSLFEKKWFVVLLSLLLSIVMWYFVVLNIDPTYTTTITITNTDAQGKAEITNSGLYIENDLDSITYRARVTGRRSQVTKNIGENFTVQLDLTKIQSEGTYQTPVKIVAPSGVTAKLLSPESIDIFVAAGEKRTMPPTIVLTGSSAGNYEITSLDRNITATGKPAAIKKISKIEVLIDCDKINSTGNTKFKPSLLDSDGNVITDSSLTVSKDVDVNIKRKKAVAVKVTTEPEFLKALRQKYDIEITPKVDSVYITGLDEDVKTVDFIEADISICKFNASSGTETVRATLTIPDNLSDVITLATGEQPFVDVTVTYTPKNSES